MKWKILCLDVNASSLFSLSALPTLTPFNYIYILEDKCPNMDIFRDDQISPTLEY